jgi:hypothetical protein
MYLARENKNANFPAAKTDLVIAQAIEELLKRKMSL